MKKYYFDISRWDFDKLFFAIRSKEDIIKVLMETITIMIIGSQVDLSYQESDKRGKILLLISKMSRLFYFSDKKFFSIHFPFRVVEEDDRSLSFYFRDSLKIDNKVISDVLSVISDIQKFGSSSLYDFIDSVDSIEDEGQLFWSFLRELMVFEDGYLRYDDDEKNERDAIHPRYHCDVFYSSNATLKLGLNSPLNEEEFVNLFDIQSNCYFLRKEN
jgi:hypothetical protein